MIEWSKVTPEQFEKICAELLEFNGFSNIEWYGKSGGDKGRDISAMRVEERLPGIHSQKKWIIQCKRYVSKRLSKQELEGFLISAREHKPDTTLLIITATLTPDVRDWLKTIQTDYRFEILIWEERDLEREVRRHANRLSYKLPVKPQSENPIIFFELSYNERIYTCNEIEDVCFYVMNAGGGKYDIPRIQEFIKFIRANEITFDIGEAENA